MQLTKNNVLKLERDLNNKIKFVVMLAPSFVADFSYPDIVYLLRALGFNKIVELTFGAKMINREYHGLLSLEKKDPRKKEIDLVISSVCPGIVETIKNKHPEYKKNLMPFVSPMVATARICRRIYPKHKIVFISPCNFKKIEAENSADVDFAINYDEFKQLISDNYKKDSGFSKKINSLKKKSLDQIGFDKFYNDYTKIYPLAGGLSKTAHLKGILKKGEERVIDGIIGVEKFLKERLEGKHKEVRFLDVTFCNGGCLGGPFIKNRNFEDKKRKLMHYLEIAKKEKMPKGREGLIRKAKGLSFAIKYTAS